MFDENLQRLYILGKNEKDIFAIINIFIIFLNIMRIKKASTAGTSAGTDCAA